MRVVCNFAVGAPTSMPGLLPDQIAPTQGNSGTNTFPATLVSVFSFVVLIVFAV